MRIRSHLMAMGFGEFFCDLRLGWADFQVRSDTAIRRHQALWGSKTGHS